MNALLRRLKALEQEFGGPIQEVGALNQDNIR